MLEKIGKVKSFEFIYTFKYTHDFNMQEIVKKINKILKGFK